MPDKRYALIFLSLLALVVSALACNAPLPEAPTPVPTMTPFVPPSSSTQEPPPSQPIDTAPAPTTPPEPPEATDSPPPTAAATSTSPPTDTPPPPTAVSTVVPTATPTDVPPAAPLEFGNPGYEIVDWQPVPDKREWEGHIRIVFTGGSPPFQSSIGHRDPQDENLHEFRYSDCRGAPLRADVWSADGQHAWRDLWVGSPWCPTSTPTP